jgi:DNA-directed RNA polymerase subunit RPC12/RpoP
MLRCVNCNKPVLLLSEHQSALVRADPDRYVYLCVECSPIFEDVDA